MAEESRQPDYQKMYYKMLDASERALETLEQVKQLLIDAEQAAEDAYIESRS